MAVTATQLQNYLKTWDSFRDIWEMDKDMFIKRYHRMNPTVAAFDSDIARSVSRATDGAGRRDGRDGRGSTLAGCSTPQRGISRHPVSQNTIVQISFDPHLLPHSLMQAITILRKRECIRKGKSKL